MKLIQILTLGVIALAITSCVSSGTEKSISELNSKLVFKIRFQNSLGLNFYYAGCSTRNLGGLERMCQYSEANPSDLTFQIGPAFSYLLHEESSSTELRSKRKVLWEIFKVQKVQFYSVDWLDLVPSLKLFEESHRGSSISLVSSNIKKGEQYLFEPYLIKEIAGKKVGIIALSEDSQKKNREGWRVETQEAAFKKISSQIQEKVELFFLVGRVPELMRKRLSEISSKPILFFGGGLMENNTTQLISEGSRVGFIKSPDFGNGFGELVLGRDQELAGASVQSEIAGWFLSFSAKLLKPVPVKFNACSQILKSAEPNSFPVEGIK